MTRERTIQAIVGALCVIALVAIIAVTSGDQIDETTGRVLASALTIAIYLLLGLAGNSLMRSGEAWSWLGGVAVTFCALGALFAVWLWWAIDSEGTDDETIARAAGITALFAIGTSHGSLLLRRIGERSDLGQVARYVTFGCGLLIAAILTAAILQDDGDVADPQFLAVLAILYVLGTVISPLLRLGERRSPTEAADQES